MSCMLSHLLSLWSQSPFPLLIMTNFLIFFYSEKKTLATQWLKFRKKEVFLSCIKDIHSFELVDPTCAHDLNNFLFKEIYCITPMGKGNPT